MYRYFYSQYLVLFLLSPVIDSRAHRVSRLVVLAEPNSTLKSRWLVDRLCMCVRRCDRLLSALLSGLCARDREGRIEIFSVFRMYVHKTRCTVKSETGGCEAGPLPPPKNMRHKTKDSHLPFSLFSPYISSHTRRKSERTETRRIPLQAHNLTSAIVSTLHT